LDSLHLDCVSVLGGLVVRNLHVRLLLSKSLVGVEDSFTQGDI